MRYQDTVFGGLMKAFPRWRFEALVKRHGADRRVRRLPCWSQFLAMLYAQLSGARSLREVIAALERFPWQPCASRFEAGAAFDLGGRQPASPGGPVRGRAGGLGGATLWLGGPARARDAAPDRRHPCDGRQADHTLAGRRQRQAACGLRPRNGDAGLLCGNLGPGQRHHACQAVSDRARRDLCVRQGLLRLRLLGGIGRQGLPLRHPAEEELAGGGLRDPGSDAGRGGAGRPRRPPLAAPGGQPQEPVRQAGPGGHCADRQRQGDHPSHQRSGRPRPKRSPHSTSSAGRSNCSSNGSSRTSKSGTSSAPARMRCASRYSPP